MLAPPVGARLPHSVQLCHALAAILMSATQAPTRPCRRRGLLRRYPDFPDMRAALAAAEWGAGLGAKAEADWVLLPPVVGIMCRVHLRVRSGPCMGPWQGVARRMATCNLLPAHAMVCDAL